MEWYEGIILGLVQGLTEFLPVSSSGHLVIFKELLGVEASEDLVFEVTVHAATVLSTLIVFRKPILDLLKGLFKFKYNDQTDYILKLCVSMIPVFIVGMFFKDTVEGLFGSSIYVVAGALLVTAALLLLSDNAGKIFGCCCRRRKCAEADAVSCKGSEPAKTTDKCAEATEAVETGAKGRRNGISYWQAFVVGLGQAIAVIPGLSRSGTTIATGLLCGVKRDVVAQFSFLMVLIPILGEAFLEIVGGDMASSTVGALPLVLGFISAFVAGLFACRVMIALVKKTKLGWFALYCAVVAVLIFVFA